MAKGSSEREHSGSTGFRRAALAMLAVGLATFNSLYATQAVLPILSTDMGLSPTEAALTVSATTGAVALCVVPFSILSEKYGRGRILIISVLSAAALGLIVPLAQTGAQLVVLRALQGVMISGTPAVAMTWLSEELDDADLPAAMGLYVAGNSIGGLTGRLIPSITVEFTSWRWALAASAAFALALAVAAAVLLPRQRNFHPKDSIRPGREFRAMVSHLRNPALVGLYACAFLGMGVFVSLYNYFGYRAMDYFNLPASVAGLIFIMYLSGTWSSARAGAIVGKVGRGRVMLGTSSLMFLGVALVASSTLWVALVGLLVLTASFFAMHSTASSWVGQIAHHDRAEASSMYLFAYYIGSSLLGAATGAAFEATSWAAFVAVLLAILTAMVLVAAALAARDRRATQA